MQLLYKHRLGEKLNLVHPKTFNEKIQWLKLYDRNPEYVKMVDKYEAKKYVASKIGEEYIVPVIGIWDSFDEINFDNLPNQFVLKCTHDSGGVVIVKDKSCLDVQAAKKKITDCLSTDYYKLGREWPYKNVKPRILAEQLLYAGSGKQLYDYKIFNFSGKPGLIQVDLDRFTGHKKNLYDINWNFVNTSINYPNDPNIVIERPTVLEDMLELSEILSAGTYFMRTDFYIVDDRIYFGEITFYPGSGFMKFISEDFNLYLGSLIKLPC